MLLILNGASSAGKSALLAALQDLYPGPLLDCGLDKFLWMLPRRYLNTSAWQEIFLYESGPAPEIPIQRIHAGAVGQRLVSGMHHAWRQLLLAGNHLAADHVLIEPAWRAEIADLLHDLPVYLIKVDCPLVVLEARERSRRDRTLGQARAQFPYVHDPDIYDFTVDTALLTPQQAAEAVMEYLAQKPSPTALQRLHTQFRRSAETQP